jgi:hypothetical protein
MSTPRKTLKSKKIETKHNKSDVSRLSLQSTKNSWDLLAARQAATLNFALEMHKEGINGPRRIECQRNNDFAKALFASIGGFYLEGETQEDPQHPLPFIPTSTVFRVFENTKESSDVLVTLVLPAADQPFPNPFLPTKVWRCTWEPY